MEPVVIRDNQLTDNLREQFNNLYNDLKNLPFRERLKKSDYINDLCERIIQNKNQNYMNFIKKFYEDNRFFGYQEINLIFKLDEETEKCIRSLHQLLIKQGGEF